jgi:hypothetical protein
LVVGFVKRKPAEINRPAKGSSEPVLNVRDFFRDNHSHNRNGCSNQNVFHGSGVGWLPGFASDLSPRRRQALRLATWFRSTSPHYSNGAAYVIGKRGQLKNAAGRRFSVQRSLTDKTAER